MAVLCPKCQNPLEQEFGVAACTQCHALLFIDMDGNAQVTEEGQSLSSQPSAADEGQTEILGLPPLVREKTQSGVADGGLQDLDSPIMAASEPSLERSDGQRLIATLPVDQEVGDHLPAENLTGFHLAEDEILGGLSYTVKIENVDTKELRLLVLDALDDPKFQWDPRVVLKELKSGAIEIRNLNPIKASVLVGKIRELPVHVSWRQNVYS